MADSYTNKNERRNEHMPYVCGTNIPGYLPESDIHYVVDFDDAKGFIIQDLLVAGDNEESEDVAENFYEAAEDVNLWGPLNESWLIHVDMDRSIPTAYWIHEVSWEEYEQNTWDAQ